MPGNSALPASADRRTARTRAAIVDAYNHLVMHRRQESIRVSDIVARANVGRSTFYEHYAGADAVFMEAVARPLALVADAAAGHADAERLASSSVISGKIGTEPGRCWRAVRANASADCSPN